MKKPPLSPDVLTENSIEVDPVMLEKLQARARELAVISGRTASHVTPADLEQAGRELSGGSELDPQNKMLDEIPEEKRADPLPDSTGHQLPESPSEDEDEEGRSESALLVEEGIKEAGHDQMLQAARAAGKIDRETQ